MVGHDLAGWCSNNDAGMAMGSRRVMGVVSGWGVATQPVSGSRGGDCGGTMGGSMVSQQCTTDGGGRGWSGREQLQS